MNRPRPPFQDFRELESRITPTITPLGDYFVVNSFTPNFQEGGDVAIDESGNAVYAWVSHNQNGPRAIYARRFAPNGTSLTGEIFVSNTVPSTFVHTPRVACDAAGNFTVTWTNASGFSSNTDEIYARQFTAAGQPLNAEFLVNATTTESQINPDIAMARTGEFVVVWETLDGRGTTGIDVKGQRFAANGAKDGGEFVATEQTADRQYTAGVAMNEGGDFAVVWLGSPSGTEGVYTRLFSRSGGATTGDVLVAQYSATAGTNESPAVSMNNQGQAVVSWTRVRPGGFRNADILARRYAADGSPLGGEFTVDPFALPNQYASTPMLANDGTLTVAWSGEADNTSVGAGQLRQFDAANQPLGDAFSSGPLAASLVITAAANPSGVIALIGTNTSIGASPDPRDVVGRHFTISGGGGTNTPPTIATNGFTAQPANQPQTAQVTIGDQETPVGQLAFSVETLTPNTLPQGNVTWTINAGIATVTVVPSGAAQVRLHVRDAGGLESTRDLTITVASTAQPPRVIINQDQDQPDPATRNPVLFTVSFTDDVAGFTADDVALTSTAPGNLTVTVTPFPFTAAVYTVAVSGFTGDGTVTATIPANRVVSTATGLLNLASNSADNTVTIRLQVVPPPPPPPPPAPLPTTFAVGTDRGTQGTVLRFDAQGQRLGGEQAPFPGFTGGVRVASADVNGDGVTDWVVGTGPGAASRVHIFDGQGKYAVLVIEPFEGSFLGGVFVAVGDLDGDGRSEIVITPDEGGGPRARVFSVYNAGPADDLLHAYAVRSVADFFGIEDPAFRGGARAAVGDVNGDGRGDLLVAAGFGGGPRVAGWTGQSVLAGSPAHAFGDVFVFETALRNGAYIAAGDVNGDGFADVIAGGGPGGGPRVYVVSGQGLTRSGTQTPLANFFAGNVNNRGGIRVAARNIDGDSQADLVVGDGAGAGSFVGVYLGRSILGSSNLFAQLILEAFPGFAGGVFVG